MIDCLALSICSAEPRTRVNALLLGSACFCLGTIVVDDALRPTTSDGISLGETWPALADRHSLSIVIVVLGNALSIRPTWRWVAGIGFDWLPRRLGDGNWGACREWITTVTIRAVAHRNMVVDSALGAETANAGTRVYAFVPFACLGLDTVAIDNAFRLAALVRVSEVLWEAAAHSDVVVHAALSVRATFAGVARVSWRLGLRSSCNKGNSVRPCLRMYT